MSLTPKPAAIPSGEEIDACAVAMAATVGHTFHTLDDDSRFRLRVFANACLVRLGLEDKPALGDRAIVRQLDGVADAVEALVRALDDDPEHGVPEAVVQAAQRAATVARTFRDVVVAADLPEVRAPVLFPQSGNVIQAADAFVDAGPDLLAGADPEGYDELSPLLPPRPEEEDVVI